MADMQPDNPFMRVSSEVSVEASPLLRFLESNSRMIGMAVGACLLAGVAYGGYTWNASRQMAKAQEELGSIMIIASDSDRLAKLQAFLSSAPSGMKAGVQLAIAKSALAVNDHATAAAAWAALANNPESPLYATAIIGQAENLQKQGKDQDAMNVLLAATVKDGSVAANLVNSALVDAAEKAGAYDKAIAACEKLVSGTAMMNPQEADFWRQKASSLRLKQDAGKAAAPAPASTPAGTAK